MLFFYIQTINLLYASVGLVMLIITLGLLYDYYCNHQQLYRRFVERFVWLLILGVAIGGVFTTLLYSEYFGFVPCSLCWLQRVALYAQAVIALVAFYYRDQLQFPRYGIALGLFGMIVAIYQYIYQLIPTAVRESVMPCLTDGTADCGTKVMEVFGFVTFPFLSAVTFLFLITLYLQMKRTETHSS
jgi:disulfide bond formation protein DsbB